ncbi:uncharacterized protein LOC133201425 [Saccostrea echinata]|uniref:uncharacterized protein LOC133201425 n=1 Tax=Saccostrea echinata TaxID=191078 RepID=UPI002A7FAE89|nr:uncharacterized protein LOC133201425 [Saccostrea echinata]
MHHIPRLSEAIYVGLCRKVGSPTEVIFRREKMDTEEMVSKPVYIMRGFDRMTSGSRREGFRLPTSDIDFMHWYTDHKVICDLSQISFYHIPQHSVILMECEGLPPGFTRLNLMTQSTSPEIRSSCIMSNNEVYISSTLFRENHLHLIWSQCHGWASPFLHGPCSTIVVQQENEVDNAYCLQSQHWPIGALPWIQRCRQQGWPSENVVSDILNGGFHVVPIGSTPENGDEWRISFSLAEQKLVYSMNHCQFLCYGLFKIFLKEKCGGSMEKQIHAGANEVASLKKSRNFKVHVDRHQRHKDRRNEKRGKSTGAIGGTDRA